MINLCSFLVFCLGFFSVNCYKPVVLIHGIMTGDESMEIIRKRIEELHPGTITYNFERFGGWSSLENMWYQVNEFGKDLLNISKSYPDGINLLGYSQGALLSRVILQAFPEHNVKTFVSLSGPQAGQYGTAFLHLIFPDIALKSAFELFYSRVGQHVSVANYWNDPHHQSLYYTYSQFLPYVNNDMNTSKSEQFKEGIKKLNKMVLIGGPDDNVITPWESSQFGYYNDVNETIASMKDRKIYTSDLIGLKTLDDAKKLVITTVPGVNHFMWHLNTTVIDEHIIPHLD